MFFIKLLILSLTVESVTELFTKSIFFYPLRKLLFKGKKNVICLFLHSLLDCGYCTSVWVSMFISIFFVTSFNLSNKVIINYFILVFILHRLSNLIHFLIDVIKLQKEKLEL